MSTPALRLTDVRKSFGSMLCRSFEASA